jgi:hypothetical protein
LEDAVDDRIKRGLVKTAPKKSATPVATQPASTDGTWLLKNGRGEAMRVRGHGPIRDKRLLAFLYGKSAGGKPFSTTSIDLSKKK